MPTPNQLACEEAIALLSAPKPHLQIQAVSDHEQLQQLWEIDKEAYQDCSLTLEEFSEWWQMYELGSRILLDGDRILASIGIYPIERDQFLDFAEGRIPERNLVPQSIEQCDRAPQSCWYASGIVTAESVRGWGSPLKTLLKLGLNHWLDSGHVAYPLSLLAIAEYEIGARLLTSLGFVKIRDGSTLPDGCDLYQLYVNSEAQIRHQLRAKGLC